MPDPELTYLRALSETSSEEAYLSPTVESTYQRTHTLGYGFDLMTGNTTPAALQPLDVKPSNRKSTKTDIRSVSSEQEMQRELDLSVSGDYNLDGTKIGGSAAYIDQLSASSKSISLIASYESTYSGYALAPADAYVLKPEARALFEEEGEAAFQKRYGQYYAAGYMYGSTFHAVYRCTATDYSRFQDFQAKVTLNIPELLDAEGSVKFSNLAKEHSVAIEASTVMIGVPTDVPQPPTRKLTPEEVIEDLNWFREHEVGEPVKTLFMSYANVLPAFEGVISVSPELLTRLKLTYNNYWLIKFLHNSLPAYYQNAMRDAYTEFTTEMEVKHAQFMQNGKMVDEFFARSGSLILTYRDVLWREGLYFKVLDELSGNPEPKTSKDVDGRYEYTKQYGVTSFATSDMDHIEEGVKYADKGASWLDIQRKTLTWSNNDKVIVGWSVKSRKEHNGDWKKTSNGDGCLGTDLELKFTGSAGRAINYKVNIWRIPRDLFRFGKLAQEAGDDEVC